MLNGVSIVSAAVVEGYLILGLSDGSVIKAGWVEGARGLPGPMGPIGARGDDGKDGNTIITVGGMPRPDVGEEGDYAIDNINWRIYGPKSGGAWGKSTELKQPPILDSGSAAYQGSAGAGAGGGGGSGSGPGGPVNTAGVALTGRGSTRFDVVGASIVNYPGSSPNNIVHGKNGLRTQEDTNALFVRAFDNIDEAIPVQIASVAPSPKYDGDLYYDQVLGELYISVADAWIVVSGGGSGRAPIFSPSEPTVHPDGPLEAGDIWYDTSDPDALIQHIYDGADWIELNPGFTVEIADSPPDPATAAEGQLYFDSQDDELTLYIFYDGQWIPAAPPVSLDGLESAIADLRVQVNRVEGRLISPSTLSDIAGMGLQDVLNNSNIADKDIVLTDGTDDLIDISTTEGRIIIASDADKKTPKLTLAHFGDQQDGNRKADIELDENGTRLDFEMSNSVKDIHFRFGNDEKFIINHEGDAEFTGKVKVQPGSNTNEAVTYGQLATLEEELEQLASSSERGTWNWTNAEVPAPGEYSIKRNSDSDALAQCDATLQECLILASDDAAAASQCNRDHASCRAQYVQAVDPDFSKAYVCTFNKKDSQGNDHNFSDVSAGMYLDIFNEGDEGFLLAKIDSSHATDYEIVFITPVQSKGLASGLARVKVFAMADEVNATNYVRKSGDTMTGSLTVEGLFTAEHKSAFENQVRIGLERSSFFAESVLTIYGEGVGGKVLDAIVRVNNDSKKDYIEYLGGIDTNNSLVNKKYVDDKFKAVPSPSVSWGVPYVYRKTTAPANLKKGEFTLGSSTHSVYAHRYSKGNIKMTTSSVYNYDKDLMVKIYDSNGALWQKIYSKKVEVGGKTEDSTYIKWEKQTLVYSLDLTDGATYYLADGFMLPY